MNQAYEFYLQTSRLDLDDYNHEVHEGLHITSMAGTWMSIVEGFGGMRIKNNQLHFSPQIPKKWQVAFVHIFTKVLADVVQCTGKHELVVVLHIIYIGI